MKTRKKELYILRIRILLALSIYSRRAGLYRQYKERDSTPKAAEMLPEMHKSNIIPAASGVSIPIIPPDYSSALISEYIRPCMRILT